MEKQIIGGLMAVLVGLAAWNMKTVNDLQLEVKGITVLHVTRGDIEELQNEVNRLGWILQDYAAEK